MVMLPACVAQVCDFHLEALRKAALGIVEGDLVLEVLEELLHCLLLFLGYACGLFCLFWLRFLCVFATSLEKRYFFISFLL